MGDVVHFDAAAYVLREKQSQALEAFKALDCSSPTFPQDFIAGMARCHEAHRRFERVEAHINEQLRELGI